MQLQGNPTDGHECNRPHKILLSDHVFSVDITYFGEKVECGAE